MNEHTPPQLIASIYRNLYLFFNTRRGAIVHLPDYGLVDLISLSETASVGNHRLLEELIISLARYEPRIDILSIKEEVNSNGFLSLSLRALVSTQKELHATLEFDPCIHLGFEVVDKRSS